MPLTLTSRSAARLRGWRQRAAVIREASGCAGIGAIGQTHALDAQARRGSVVEQVEQEKDGIGQVGLSVPIDIEESQVGGVFKDSVGAGQRLRRAAEEVAQVNNRVGNIQAAILGDVAGQLAAALALGVFPRW